MPTTRQNKSTTPANSDAYNLVPDLNTLADSLNVTIPVSSQTERDALTKSNGLLVTRLDKAGAIEYTDGTNWYATGTTKALGHLGKTDGFQSIGTSGTAVTMTAAAQILRGGMTQSGSKLVVPLAGLYTLRVKGYATGGTAYKHTALCTINGAASGAITEFWKQDTNDYQCFASAIVQLSAGDQIGLNAYTSVSGNTTWGTTGYDGCYIEVEYWGA